MEVLPCSVGKPPYYEQRVEKKSRMLISSQPCKARLASRLIPLGGPVFANSILCSIILIVKNNLILVVCCAGRRCCPGDAACPLAPSVPAGACHPPYPASEAPSGYPSRPGAFHPHPALAVRVMYMLRLLFMRADTNRFETD